MKVSYLSDLAVRPFGYLLQESFVLCELLLVRERDAVDTLEGIVVRVSEEVGRGALWTTISTGIEISQCVIRVAFVTMNALIFPVCGMWGPRHKSTMGPQR